MTDARAGGRLRGRRIVVTRPAGQNERLAALIRAEGGEAIVFPALAILDPEDGRPLAAAADRLEQYDLAVFVSPSAVEKAMPVLRSRRAWPAGLRAATVGPGSAQALRRHGVAEAIVPAERFDSEGLLEHPALANVAGRRIVVFRGDGGRELLGETLQRRGATVEYVACYRRARPDGDAGPLLRALDRGEVDAVTASSSEGLRNLFDLLGERGRPRLQRTPLFVPHERIAAGARALGCERVVATSPGDEGLAAALVAFWERM
jgi:uroporphyrinogen-III synthase